MKRDSCKAYGTRAQGKITTYKKKPISQDYQKLLDEVKILSYKWHTAGVELVMALHKAKKQFGRQKKQWKDFCVNVGLDSKMADKWLSDRKTFLNAIDEVNAKLAKRKKYGK